MKNIPFLCVAIMLLTSCNNTKTKSSKRASTNAEKFITLEIDNGPFRGTHKFVRKKGKLVGGIGIHYFDATEKSETVQNTFSLEANNLISESGLSLHSFAVRAKGEVKRGKHEVVDFKDSNNVENCTSINLSGEKNTLGTFSAFLQNGTCQPLKIESLGSWTDKTHHHTRIVEGTYTLSGQWIIQNANGDTLEKTESSILVTFSGEHEVLKDEYSTNH